MASIFEELMSVNSNLTESVRPSVRGKKVESKKIPFKNLKVESVKVFEDADFDDLDKQFDAQPTGDNPDEVVLVIDPEIQSGDEIPEDAAEKMVGDLVYKCPVCGSNYVCGCDPEMQEGIELDDEGVPVECPICGDDAEQILVGEIAPAEETKPDEETEPELLDNDDSEDDDYEDQEKETSEDDEELEEESLTESEESSSEFYGVFEKGGSIGKSNATRDDLHAWSGRDAGTLVKVFSSSDEAKNYAKRMRSRLSPGERSYYGMGYFVKKLSKKDLEHPQVVDMISNMSRSSASQVAEESLKEDFDEGEPVLDLEIPEVNSHEEESAPAVQVKDSQVTLVLDDKRFESLMNQVISENYKNDPKFKINRCSVKEGKLRIQYTVTEGKSSKKGLMIAEGFDKKSRKMTLKFKDKGAFTESFSRTPSFVIECVKIKNAVIPTSVKYNYKVKVNESLYRVKGYVKSGK